MNYPSLEHLVLDAFQAMRPQEILTVTEAAQKYHIIRQPGAHSGPWSPEKTPYMVEVQNLFTSLDYTGVCFVGPARSGKSAASLNWLIHTAISDPADMLIVQMTQNDARKWSKLDLAKMFRDSETMRSLLRPGRVNDNVNDKEFRSGMRLTIVWPTVNNLSSITVPRVMLMDYDRMPDDVDGEGSPFDLAKKRTTTFKRFGMTYVESSPNPAKEIEDARWIPKSPHQAPPIRGIFEIYNRGDRRLWHWECPSCHDAFEPHFKHLTYPDTEDPFEAGEAARMKCPSCGHLIHPRMKEELNNGGRWVRDGMIWLPREGQIVPIEGRTPARSDIASFWLKGPAAGYQEWKSLVVDYIRAEQAYVETGDESPLKKTVTADQGNYYIPKSRQSERKPEELKEVAEDWGSTQEVPTVPWGVRFLIATVDVQARSFVVQINGFAPNGDMFVIDGFKITMSIRRDEEGNRLPMAPPAFAEDWELLREVIGREYPLADGSGRMMKVLLTACDSGGQEGTTHHAYNFWRSLKAEGEGLHRRFMLVKGGTSITAPRALVSFPDSNQRGIKAVAKGDVPICTFNSTLLKDQVAAMLQRRVEADDIGEDRGGMIRYPDWMPDWFYSQMTAEVREPKGWKNTSRRRNEAFDLSYYAIGAAIRPPDRYAPFLTINLDKLNWDEPPLWARDWDENDNVYLPVVEVESSFSMEVESQIKDATPKRRTFEEIGAMLAGR